MVHAGWILQFVYGGKFELAATVATALAPYVVCTVVNTIHMTLLIAANKEREVLHVIAPGTALLAVAALAGAAMWGAWGTAVGLSFAEFVMMVAFIVKARGIIVYALNKFFLVSTVAAVVMLAVQWTSLPFVHPVVAMIAGAAVYYGTLVLLKGIDMSDMQSLKERLV
jgi:O-antigen/teichoic acid export membrane protein